MGFYYFLLRFLDHRNVLLSLLAVAVIASAFSLRSTMALDDYIQWGIFTSPHVLLDKELISPEQSSTVWGQLGNQFNFFNREMGTQSRLKEWGAIPWWSDPEASLHLFRPVSSLTHWLDYKLWPNTTWLMLAHSLFYYLLLLTAMLAAYKKIMPSSALAALAVLFFIFDPSNKHALVWLASRNAVLSAFFGLAAFYAHLQWRLTSSNKSVAWFILSIVTLLAALLSAEAGLAIFAYMFAFALILDKGPLLTRMLTVLPAALVIIVWRVTYQKMGFGAENIGHYIDPARDPLYFFQHLFTLGPQIAFYQFSGLDNLDRLFSFQMKTFLNIFAITFTLGLLALFFSLLKRNKQARFWALGIAGAAVPPCALTHVDGRVMMFVAFGAFPLVVLYIEDIFSRARSAVAGDNKKALQQVGRFRRITAATFIYFYVIVLGAGHIAVTLLVYGFTQPTSQAVPLSANYDYSKPGPLAVNKHLIVVASPSAFDTMYFPYHAAYNDLNLPLSARTLSPLLSQVEVTRVSATQFNIKPKGGFIISNQTPLPDEAAAKTSHDAHNARNMMGFFRRHEFDFKAGQKIVFDEIIIEVIEVDEGRPTAIQATLKKDKSLEDFQWITWDWEARQFVTFELPKIGDSIVLAGPFDHLAKAFRLNN